MKCHVLVGSLLLAWSPSVQAETARKAVSCTEVAARLTEHQVCMVMYAPYGEWYCAPPAATQCWDFENLPPGSLGAWTRSGTAFGNQPTYGDNVTAWRALQTQVSPLHPQSGSVLDDLRGIGGEYWETPYPIGHQGRSWIGTYEDRNTEAQAWNGTQLDGPTGTAISPAFVIDRDLVTFLIGGGCDRTTEYVELQIYHPPTSWCIYELFGGMTCFPIPESWTRAVAASGEEQVRSGRCLEALHRDGFWTSEVTGFQGKTARIAIVDNSSGSWGHINVDHILHQDQWPNDYNYANVPVWGLADTHAHMGNHLAMKSLGTTQLDGYAFHGSPGTITTDRTLLAAQLPSCDSQGHGTAHAARLLIHGLETSSLGSSPNFPVGCNPAAYFGSCSYLGHQVELATPFPQQHWGSGIDQWGGSDLVGWPYWYTRAHQQMHLTWVKRAYQGGQRLMFASVGNTELIGMAMRGSHLGTYLSDYGALRRFPIYMKALASANSTWMEIALTPADARRIIQGNKLAIVLATEVDDLGDHCAGDLASTAADHSFDHNMTTTTEGRDPWNLERDRTFAASCTTAAEWTTRVANLNAIGYRVIMPVHLADNALGGTAVYDEMFNTNSRFVSGGFVQVQASPDVGYVYPEQPVYTNWAGTWRARQAGWTNFFGIVGGQSVGYSVSEYVSTTPVPYPYLPGYGHINQKSTTSDGLAVIAATKARGMILDLAHLGQLGRQKVLGLGAAGNRTTSPLLHGCDMSDPICQGAAYPVIASHAGLRELQPARDVTGGGPNENALDRDMIERIRDIGGTVAVGTSAGDANAVDAAAPGTWSGIYAQTVANSCAGSSRTFAQGYLYALRRMNGKGVTLGTDINGLEDRLNPRFGTQGCYARGNVPHAKQVASDGSTLLVDDTSGVPFRYRPAILHLADGTAGAQRLTEFYGSFGLRYAHYQGVPSGGRFAGLWDPTNYRTNMATAQFGITNYSAGGTASMLNLSPLPALQASVTGNRTFDLNYDGLAHYGMLPDLLQDARTVGLTNEQLGPLFQGAEAVIQTWEKGCSLSNPSLSSLGCN